MIVPDVIIYTLFGLNYSAISALVRIIVTALIIILTIQIPFKRRYHWIFLVLSVDPLLGALSYFYWELAPDLATAVSRAYVFFSYTPGHTRLIALLTFVFVALFVARKMNPWQKLVVVGGLAYWFATDALPMAIGDTSLVYGKVVATSLGWVAGPGTTDTYLRPYGLDIFTGVIGILILAMLIRYYRSEKFPLVRDQTTIIIIGVVLFLASSYANSISRDLGAASIPNLQQFIGAAGDLVLLLGLRRKGFYSVSPVAETASGTTIRYPLQEAHSYLAHDQKSAFESFSELVRNGHEGLMITRTFPENVRKEYGIQTTPIRWLAEGKGADGIPPGDLLGLSLTVKDFLEKAKNPVVMLHGIEYLTSFNGFTPILRLIQGLSEENATKRGILILPVLPDTLTKQDEAFLASETTPMPMPAAS